MATKALIAGITGQDGSYLTEFLLKKGYEVHGLVRPSSTLNRSRISHLTHLDEQHRIQRNIPLFLHYGNITDSSSLKKILVDVQPDEVYQLAAQSHVKISFDIPEYTADTTALGTLRMLESIKEIGLECRFYQAGSSEMFGKVKDIPQKETTPFYPRSPYGAAKVYAHWIAVNYREAYDLFVCNGILFNHESPRRGENFVTRKISLGVAAIKLGFQDHLLLGNLEARRDWGYAKDYVEAMWSLLQQETPDDYVIATGESHSVREFCELAFDHVGLDYKDYVIEDMRYYRPTEVDCLVGDASKAYKKFGWHPKTCFADLVRLMVDSDIELLKRDRQLCQMEDMIW